MKQKIYLTFFVLFLLNGFISTHTLLTTSMGSTKNNLLVFSRLKSPVKEIDLEGLYAFKSPARTGVKYATRIGRSARVQCLSVDGEQCLDGIQTDQDVRQFLKENIDQLLPYTCKISDIKNRSHWCNKARKYFFKRWRCPSETGLSVAIRMNEPSFNVLCLSENGKHCLENEQAEEACQKVNTCPITRARMKFISCGEQHKRLFGTDGYTFEYPHWCKKGFAFYRYTGEMVPSDSSFLDTPIRLSITGEVTCLTEKGKDCMWGVTGRDQMNKKNNLYLACGEEYKKLFFTTGFDKTDHWCMRGYEYFYKRKGSSHSKKKSDVEEEKSPFYKKPKFVKATGKNPKIKRKKKASKRKSKALAIPRGPGRFKNIRNRMFKRKLKEFRSNPKIKLLVNKSVKKHNKGKLGAFLRKVNHRGDIFKSPRKVFRTHVKLSKFAQGNKKFWTKILRMINSRKPIRKIIRKLVLSNFGIPNKFPKSKNKKKLEIDKMANRLIKNNNINKNLAKKDSIYWSNAYSHFKHNGYIRKSLVSNRALPKTFSIDVKLNDFYDFSLGLTINEDSIQINTFKGTRQGEWAIWGKSGLMEEGKFKSFGESGNFIQPDDIITLWGQDSKIGYRINGEENGYSYELEYENKGLWLIGTFYDLSNNMEILDNAEIKKLSQKRNEVRKMVKSLIKKPFMKNVKKMIRSVKLGTPEQVIKIKKTLQKNSISGRKGFWNKLFNNISQKKPFKNIVKIIAKQKLRPLSWDQAQIKKMRSMLDNNPWIEKVCRWNLKRGKNSNGDFEKLVSKYRVGKDEEFRDKLWKSVKENKPCVEITQMIRKKQLLNRQVKIDKIIKRNLLTDITWQNGDKVWTHSMRGNRQVLSKQKLPEKFAVNIRANKVRKNHITLGVKNNQVRRNSWWSYVGWAPGEWGITDHTAVFAYQRVNWHDAWMKRWKTGAVLTIWGNNGKVGMRLNGQDNKYVYDMKTTDLWLAFTLYNRGDQLELLGSKREE